MNKIFLKYLVFLLVSSQVLGQQSLISAQVVSMNKGVQASSKKQPNQTNDLPVKKSDIRKPAPDNINTNVLPFFGNYDKTSLQKQIDENFLLSCDMNFENRQEASKFFSARAWEYLNEGQADTATHRFNLAWLLNANNVEPYWGLGVISYQNAKLQDAIAFLEKGHELDMKNATLVVDLATVHLQCFVKNNTPDDLSIADKLLQDAIQTDPAFATGYMKFSLLKLIENKYDEAWGYFHKGYDADINSLDFDLLSSLLEKQSDPKGKFKK